MNWFNYFIEVECATCEGKGVVEYEGEIVTCWECDGKGFIWECLPDIWDDERYHSKAEGW